MIDGVTADNLIDYSYDIDVNTEIGFSDFADVVTRWKSFRPCAQSGGTNQYALDSFHYDWAMDTYITEADNAGVHVILPLPFNGDVEDYCDGYVPEGSSTPMLFDHPYGTRIPLWTSTYAASKDLISSAFTSYWTERAEIYVNEIETEDTNDTVWGWRVIEELRYWLPNEMEFALAVRDTVNTYDGTRPIMSYSAASYLSGPDMLYTLAEKTQNSSNAECFQLEPATPIAHQFDEVWVEQEQEWVATVVSYYPKTVAFERDSSHYMIQMFDHVLNGSYMDLWFGENDDEDRIFPYHRIRLGRETLDNLAEIYASNEAAESISQSPPEHILFHAPGMVGYDETATSATARHDFWSGIHEATGVWIYSFGLKDEGPGPVWDQYIRALYLIKSEMRTYLASGAKSNPDLVHDGSVTLVPGDDYLPVGDDPYLAMPPGGAGETQYTVFNQTLFRISDVGYLIVTNSWEQSADITVTLSDCIASAEIVSGSSGSLSTTDDTLSDSFDGVDGRVYKITFETCT